MYDWETWVNDWKWDYHSWLLDKANTSEWWGWDALSIFPTKATQWKAIYDKFMKDETLNKFLQLKKDWATFGAMSDSEWKIIWDSVSKLKWDSSKKTFQTELRNQINDYIKAMKEKWVAIPQYSLQYGGKYPESYTGWGNSMIEDLM
jgi:hypothetical protein